MFENAFPNGASTASSTTSMIAGRLPTETGVIYPPDIAKGDAAHLHLPGLLRRLGYRTGQFSLRWYADASDFNLQGAFDWANSRSTSPMKGIPGDIGDIALDRLGQMSAYFLTLMRGRLEERLLPLFLRSAAPQQDPFRMVHDNTIPAHGDERRLRELFQFIDCVRQALLRPCPSHRHPWPAVQAAATDLLLGQGAEDDLDAPTSTTTRCWTSTVRSRRW